VDDCPVACDTVREALKTKSLRPPPDKDRFSIYGRGDTLLCEGGRERGVIDILGRTLRIDAGVFFQSNGALLETLITELRALAGETAVPDTSRAAATVPDTSKVSGTGNAADFYCGVGTFAVFLADMFQAIDLVEENTAALALARENLRMPTAAFFAMSADKWVKSVSRKRPPYRFIVVDPPRAGLSKTMCGWLRANPPETLAYVSCDYRSLARNAQALTGGGLKLDALTYYDFYPQTPHIETLAVFRVLG
jgi:23S rRNA (uracil1939-C5)-methyltransferase